MGAVVAGDGVMEKLKILSDAASMMLHVPPVVLGEKGMEEHGECIRVWNLSCVYI